MHPKTSKRKTVLAPTCQELLCRGLNPVLDLTTTALQRPVLPLEVRVTAGGWSFVEREVFGLNSICMEAAKERECLGMGLEASPQGRGEGGSSKHYVKSQPLAASPASWAARWMDLGDLRHI